MSSNSDSPLDSDTLSLTASSQTAFTSAETTCLSSLQTGLFATSISQPGTWIGSHVFALPPSIDIPRFKYAWSAVVLRYEILRSRIVWNDGQPDVAGSAAAGMRMLVLDEEDIEWEERVMEGDMTLASVIRQLRARNMRFGQKLSAFTILRTQDEGINFIWTMHHALYDNSHLLVLDDVLNFYHNETSLPPRPSFTQVFLDKQIAHIDYAAAATFWAKELTGCEDIEIFPPFSKSSLSRPQTRVETPFPFPAPKRTIVASATNSTLIRAAWAIVVAKHTGTKDVVFGCTVAGRYDEATKGVVGPTFATVPVRVKIGDEERKTLVHLLEELQSASTKVKEHEQVGLQFIQSLDVSAKRAASFQNLLVVQPKGHPTPAPVTDTTICPSYPKTQKFEFIKTHLDLIQTYGLVMEVTPSSSGNWLLVAKYDDRLLSATEVERICCHFSKAIQEVFREENRDLGLEEIDLLTEMDLKVIKELASASIIGNDICDSTRPGLLHQGFERMVNRSPDSVAIDAWDLSLTYAQLEKYGKSLAQRIHHSLVHDPENVSRGHSIIPICFSKSAYAIVAMLAVLQAGCAYLPIDAGWPSERITAILEGASGREGSLLDFVLCDDEQKARFDREGILRRSPGTKILAVGKELLGCLQPSSELQPSCSNCISISPSDLAYVIFTSGTTGRPKGIAVSHNACFTNFQSRLSRLHSYTSTTRVLQFSSFAFDVSVFDIFGTLSAGGCIVVPHESYRINPSRLSQFMTERRVSWASLPPAFARFLDPADVPSLETLVLGGEMLTRDIITKWKNPGLARKDVILGNELGPSEICVACVGNYNVDLDTDPKDLGRPIGGNKLFLVDKDNSSRLVPAGCVGELLVYGQSVMDGYLNNHNKTKEVFVGLPDACAEWIPMSDKTRGFKTGDLFYLDDRGHLMYVGRKDRQLKLRGFRMEAAEIEACMKLEDGVKSAAVEIMVLHEQHGRADNVDTGQELVVFFALEDAPSSTGRLGDSKSSVSEAVIISPSRNPEIAPLVRRIQHRVRDALPHYMHPSIYIPVSHIPMTSSGKQDRNQLRCLVNGVTRQIFQELYSISRINCSSLKTRYDPQIMAVETPLSPLEQKLKALWTQVLGLSHKNSIGLDSDFFHLGGNSIKAIQLSALAAKQGWGNLDVLGIYEYPTLREMSVLCFVTTEADIVEFRHLNHVESRAESRRNLHEGCATTGSMEENSADDARKRRICTVLGLDPIDVEDLYPCTPLQEGLLATSIRQPGTYVVGRIWRLGCEIDTKAFRDAWELTIERNEILRTRIIEDEERLWQVVVAQSQMDRLWQTVEEREIKGLDLSAENKQSIQKLACDWSQGGRRLSFFEILNEPTTGERYFKWTIHHAVYDAWVLSMVWAQVRNSYQMLTVQHSSTLEEQPRGNFAQFIRSTYQSDLPSATKTFWKTYLSTSEPWQTFPTVSKAINSIPQTDNVISQHFEFDVHTIPGVTEASLIRAAWAWVQALYLGVDDIVFGVTLSGRSAPGASHVIGPTITTVPVRVTVSPDMEIKEFLRKVQEDAKAMMKHEHIGLSQIRGLSETTGWACDFANILVVQDERGQKSFVWDDLEAVSTDTDITHSIPLVLECVLEDTGLTIHAIFGSQFLSREETDFLIAHLGKAVESLSNEVFSQRSSLDQKCLGEIDFFSEVDTAWIQSWNQEEKPSANRLIHEVFRQTAEQYGSKIAIDAWDAHFTFEELDHASDIVAKYLAREHQVGPGVLVAVSFEKSGWAVLAMLAIWKAGGGFVPLDLSNPTSRLEDILDSTQIKIALCSASRSEQLESLVTGVVLVLNHESVGEMKKSVERVEDTSSACFSQLVTPQDICYVLFTSGSTGRPKGVILEHASVSTSLLGHADSMKVKPSSRVLQFAAYTFDTSIGEIFTALLVGATLCVPSEQQRLDSLVEFINEKSVNWLWLTPTVAGFLDPRAVPGVETMVIGGEAASTKLFQSWIGNGTTLVYGYGPTETSITVTFDVDVTVNTDPGNIGIPICASTWIVDPRESTRLLPIGCVGELVVSGPTVGRGYLDQVKTALAFGVVPDTWESLVRREKRGNSQRERYYKTGDLVRYDATGNITFLGRKDDQVKLHGQRIELSEITNRVEAILSSRCSSIVQKIDIPSKPDSEKEKAETLLVAFFTLPDSGQEQDDVVFQEHDKAPLFRLPSPESTQVINDVETDLQNHLPRYMIPSLYVPLRFVPITTTGKVDRKRLKNELLQVIHEFGRGNFMPEKERLKEQPRDGLERQLQELWCPILGLRTDQVGIRDSFLRLGGDSMKAISLGYAARRVGLHVSVADIFLHPILSDMADFVRDSRVTLTQDQGLNATRENEEGTQVSAFSMLNDDTAAIKRHASKECGISVDDIEDIYPCTAMQAGMIVASSLVNTKKYGLYVLQRRISLPSPSAATKLLAAWEIVRRRTPILRTRIIQYQSQFYQVIEKGDCVRESHPSASETSFCGRRLAELTVGPNYDCEIFLHHSIYDAALLPHLLEDVRREYCELISDSTTLPSQSIRVIPFRDFIHHLQGCDEKAAFSFWTHYLAPKDGTDNKIGQGIFPPILQQSPGLHPQRDGTSTNEVCRYFIGDKIENKPHSGITLANVLNSAWAIVVARHTGVEEVMFGNTLSGRDVILGTASCGSDGELIEGPTLTTVPLRFQVGRDKSVTAFLHEAQRDAVKVRLYQHFGMNKISKAGNSEFRTLVVVQTAVDCLLGDDDVVVTTFRDLPGVIVSSECRPAQQEYPLVLECLVSTAELKGVRAYYDEGAIERSSVVCLLAHFEQAIRTLVTPTNQHLSIGDISLVTEMDLSKLREWNANPREASRKTLLDLFLARAAENPEREALHSTEITLSYKELDCYSNYAARHICERMGDFHRDTQTPFTIAICYEKSVWAVVAILAIMKIGAAYVPLDPSSPDSRLAMILDDAKASTIVCSQKQAKRFSEREATSKVIVFDGETHDGTYTEEAGKEYNAENPITAESLAYILFTSGSTGRPKGVLVPHGPICTSILAFSPVVKLSQDSRVLQFSSFGFDASVGEIFATLSAGGCVCLPSDEERLANVSRFMNECRVNWAFLTPVTLRVITPDDVPLLRVLVVGGEPLPPSLFKIWAARPERLQLMEAYGPTECCVFSTMNTVVTPDTHPQDIGFPLGGATWIVDPHDYDKLAPVGCIGELVISGNTIATGYHNLPTGSTSGFIERTPEWASFFLEHTIRRIYRTGDLAKFKADGSIHYVARKDNQVNLRGMRMELGEIEYHLARSAAGDKSAPIVVMTEIPSCGEQNTAKSALACFFVAEHNGRIKPEPLRMTEQRKQIVRSILSYLEGKIPRYMHPTMFIPLPCFPENTSGKVERKILTDDILGKFDADDFKHYTVSTTTEAPAEMHPITATEETLKYIWSQLLRIDSNIIKQGDSFFRLGGDSVDVIRMVAMLRDKGWHLSPVEAMADPKLSSIASKIRSVGKEDSEISCRKTSHLSLLRRELGTSGAERLSAAAAKQCGVAQRMIEDIYPCTSLQEGLLSVSERIPGSYFNRQAWALHADVDIDRLVAAYRGLCKAHPILRTRIIRGYDEKSYQVVLREDVEISSGLDVEVASHTTASGGCGALSGKPLHSVAILHSNTASGSKVHRKFVRILHHALYDAWSLAHLDAELAERYAAAQAFTSPAVPSYTRFIEYITEEDTKAANEYWGHHLDGAKTTHWPSIPHNHQPQTSACIQRTFKLDWTKFSADVQDHTKATVAQLAWAAFLSKHSNETDISFGVALSGRDTPVEGIERMTGPTNTTIPVRYQFLDGSGDAPSITDMLQTIKSRMKEMSKFQHYGLQNIMRISPDIREVCNFNSLLVVQPVQQLQQWAASRSRILQELPGETQALVHPYPLVIEICFQSQGNDAEIWVHYDEHLFDGLQVDLIVRQLHSTLQALISSDPLTSIDLVDINDQTSLRTMRRFHDETCNVPAERDIVSLMSHQRMLKPEALAISAWDGTMTYADLDVCSSILSVYLRDTFGLKSQGIVATCFEKSCWAIVTMLAIMKAGGAYAPIDPSAPDSYKRRLLDQIFTQGQNNLVLMSEEQYNTIRPVAPPGAQLLTVTKSMVAKLPHSSANRATNMASPASVAYVLFTSGSTGAPKGVVMEHRSACSSILAHGVACKFRPSTRALQFAAFTFDASIMEIWTTLAFGGCICMPSESQRVDNLERYMEDACVNWAFLTPTVSGLIRKERVRSLETLVLGGEALTVGNVQKWTATHHCSGNTNSLQLMNGYGPTECCVFTCVNTQITPTTEPQDVGRAIGTSAWIVDPKDYNRLMPLTCPGELIIIGPALAREYLGDPAKTKQAFVYPQWSKTLLGAETRAYRTGDMASCGLDGHIRILGRIDTQIKLHGMRIELGEIENAILSCASTLAPQFEVIVDSLAPSTPGDKDNEASDIVAFLKFGGSNGLPSDIESFKRQLSARMVSHVPKYMIPSHFVTVSRFPATAAGKVDRKLLQKLFLGSGGSLDIIIDRSPPLRESGAMSVSGELMQDNGEMESASEVILRDLWAEVLRIENPNLITRHDNFFALGGESIRAIRLVGLAREKYHLCLTVNEIFRHPLLADMAAHMIEIVEEVVEDEPFDLLMLDD